MKVYVVMGNDFPGAVYATKEAADSYCHQQIAAGKVDNNGRPGRIYWRVYEFELREKA